MLGFVFAVLAAVSNATSNLLQRAASRRVAPELSLSAGLLKELARQPVWATGMLLIVVSFLLQAAALDRWALAAVQPVIVMELPLALVGGALVFRVSMRALEWVATLLMTVGLCALIGFLDPRPQADLEVGGVAWVAASAATVAVIGALFLAGWRARGGRRAAFWGAATGVDFGLTAAYMKAMTHALAHGITAVVTTWPTYAMIGAGIAGMYLAQNAFHAGPLVAAQPGMTLLDPFTAIFWGVLVFGEPTNHGLVLVWAALGAVLLAAGGLLLVRSPLLQDATVS